LSASAQKGKPHTEDKSQDAATSMEDAFTKAVHISGVDTSCVRYLKNVLNSMLRRRMSPGRRRSH
jgi:hypothetical protein